MKKIFCNMGSEDYIKVSHNEEYGYVFIRHEGVAGDRRENVELTPASIRKLRKQLKKALAAIEGETDKDDNWFSKGHKVKITGNDNSHEFPIGEIVEIKYVGDDEYAHCSYLDGHDWWYVPRDDCKPA